jgi:hypothetical protein
MGSMKAASRGGIERLLYHGTAAVARFRGAVAAKTKTPRIQIQDGGISPHGNYSFFALPQCAVGV